MITPPTNCPSCDSLLEWTNDTLYCKNNSCPAKASKQVEHFAKSLKIKGLGPSTIEKLLLENIVDIYELDVEYIKNMLGSERLAIKLFEEIERSKQEPLNTVLPGFGIPLIGRSATAALSKVCDDIFEINEYACKAAGLGPKATANLLNWIETEWDHYCDLPFSFEFTREPVKVVESKGVVCISGKLKSYKTKAEASEALKQQGFEVKDSLTKEVTILLNESGVESTKTKKADTMGIRIVNNIQELMENI